MVPSSALLYERIYLSFKNYGAEAELISTLLRRECPRARRLLDVGCGTGEHARLLREMHGFEVDGLDIEPSFVELARAKNPDGRFVREDMADFDLARTYDAVLCLFGTIGYARTLDRLTATLGCFAAHVGGDGLIVVEPWFAPGALEPGRIFVDTSEAEDFSVTRMARASVDDRLSTLEFHYLVGCDGEIAHEHEKHVLGLFTDEEMRRGFDAAGLRVDLEAGGPCERGLYLARRA